MPSDTKTLSELPPPPTYNVIVPPGGGVPTPVWTTWFTQMYNRIGGAVTTPNQGLDVISAFGGGGGADSGPVGSVNFAAGQSSAPSNTTTPVAWQDVYVNGIFYKMPLYQ